MENCMEGPQNIKNLISSDPTILYLGVYPEELKSGSQRDTCTSMITEVLFKITKTWREPKTQSKDEQTKEMWYKYEWTITQPLKRRKFCTP